MNKKEKLKNIFKYIEKECGRNPLEYVEIKDVLEMSDYDELYQELEELDFFEVNIIYYTKAIHYLQEHDPSLTESIELASDMGYNIKDINSELLASILASEYIATALSEYYDELEDILRNNE